MELAAAPVVEAALDRLSLAEATNSVTVPPLLPADSDALTASSSDDEGWLLRCDADEAPGISAADVREALLLPNELYTYTLRHPKQLAIFVRTSAAQGIGHQLWRATFLLLQYIEDRRDDWKGKRVLELGSGCGLVGLVLASLGAEVVVTDLPCVLDLLRSNIEANAEVIASGGGKIHAAALSWGEDQPPDGWTEPDFVMAVDVVYHRHLYQPLLSTLQHFGPAMSILVAGVRRWKHEEGQFYKPARKQFQITDLAACVHPETNPEFAGLQSLNRLRLYQLRKK